MKRDNPILKSSLELKKMEESGKILCDIIQLIISRVCNGITTDTLSDYARSLIRSSGAEPLFLGVACPNQDGEPYPAPVCISVNEQVVHGIPSKRVLKSGDIISIDCGIKYRGWCSDMAFTIGLPPITTTNLILLEITRSALKIACEYIGKKKYWTQVASVMEDLVNEYGLKTIEDYVGHGIGKNLHEPPKVPNYVNDEHLKYDIKLLPGLVLAIEPMVCVGTKETYVDSDKWTVITKDSSTAAHYEHTVALTSHGPRIITDN